MKIELLKNIIKESVREAVREELKELLTELVNPKTVESKTKEIKTTAISNTSVDINPLSEMINMTRQNMNSSDFQNILNSGYKPDFSNLNSSNSNYNFVSSEIPRAQTGIDISKLDFVKNAASIYNKSLEKDKARLS